MAANKLRTIHIDSEVGWSGGQRQVSALCSYLQKNGHDVRLICRPGSKLEHWAKEEGIPSEPVDMKSTLSLSAVLRIRNIIAREKPDVVHLHASRAHVLGSAAASLVGNRLVVVTRRMDERVRMAWPNTSAYGKWVDAIIAISAGVRDVLIESGVDPEKIHVIESGCDVDAFAGVQPDDLLRGPSSDVPIIAIAATLTERKGANFLIDACSILRERGVETRLIIAGDGPDRQKLEIMAKERQVSACFLEFYADMPRFMASADIFVMPSLGEGLGVAVLEAMAAGKPVVASAVGGLRESVVDGVTGFLIPPREPLALADAIGRLIEDSRLAAEFGIAGQARAREKFSLDNMARRNEELYIELLRGR